MQRESHSVGSEDIGRVRRSELWVPMIGWAEERWWRRACRMSVVSRLDSRES